MAIVIGFDLDTTAAGSNEAVSYFEGTVAIRLASNASVSAIGNFNGQRLTLSGLLAEDQIGFASGVTIVGASIKVGGITIGSFAGGTGGSNLVITFNGNASAARVQTLVRNLTYSDGSDTPTLNHTLNFNLAGTTRTDAVSVIAVNDAPVLDLNGAGAGDGAELSYTEGEALKVIAPSAVITDVDSANFDTGFLRVAFVPTGASTDRLAIKTDAVVTLSGNVVSVNGIAIGTVTGGSNGSALIVVFNNSSATPALVTTLVQHIAYASSSESQQTGIRGLNFTIGDGDGTANGGSDRDIAVASITLNRVNDAPVVDLNGSANGTSATLSYNVSGPLTKIAPAGTITDVDSADFNTGSLRVAFTTNGTPTDRLVIIPDATVTLSGATVRVNGTAIGTVSGGNNGTDLLVTFNSSATKARVQTLLEHIGYSNSSGNPSLLARTVTFTVIDGDGTANGGQSTGSATATITLVSPNIPPVLTGDLTATVDEGGSYAITTSDLNFSDPDDGAANVTFTISSQVNGTLKVNNAIAMSFTGVQLVGGQVTFEHNGSETTSASFAVRVEDGYVQDSSTPVWSTFNFTVTPVNDPPVLTGDLIATVDEGGSYTITTSDLNFSDPDDGAANVTFTISSQVNGTLKVNNAIATSFTGQQLAGGQVTFEHNGSETTSASFAVLVEDGNEDSSAPVASTFGFTVTPQNDAPTTTTVTLAAALEDKPSRLITQAELLANASDVDSASLLATGLAIVSGAGSLTDNLNGTWSYTPALNDDSSVSFSYTVTDGSLSAPGSATLDILPENDAPTTAAVTLGAIAEDSGARQITQAELLANASDVDNGIADLTAIGLVISSGAGSLAYNGSGTWSYTPALNDDSSVSFSYTVTDGSLSAPGSATLDITPHDDTLNLADLDGSNGFRIDGVAARDYSGVSVSAAGDFNADGLDDFIIGSYYTHPNGADSGSSYVVFGVAAGFPATVALSGLNGSSGFRIDGVGPGDLSARSVSAAGDVNGDGFDDVIVAGVNADPHGPNSGSSYIVFGTDVNFGSPLALSSLNGSNGFRIDGAAGFDQSGVSISAAGDVNGDGFDDVIVGAYGADPNGVDSSSSYVVFGSAGGFPATFALSSLNGTNGFRIDGVAAGDSSGNAVSTAGDINGDGFDDLIIAASHADPNGTDSGSSYVVFGSAAGFPATLALSSLNGSNGFRMDGMAAGDNSGRSISTAGDVNGDGYDDIIVGANGADLNGVSSGSSYVVFGSAAGFSATLSLSSLSGNNGFRIDGLAAGDNSGVSVSVAGDVNGDGYDDLIVGAFNADPNGVNSGSSYVMYGTAAGFPATVALSSLDGSNGFRIAGVAAGDSSGNAVKAAGDVNGDGFDDIIVGAALADPNGIDSGSSYVIFGHASDPGTIIGTAAADAIIGTSAAESFVGGQGDDTVTGGGGADAFQGGAGNDTIIVGNAIPLDLNGGSGIDTANLDATGGTIDLSGLNSSRFADIEKIDLTGGNTNILVLDKQSVLDMAGTNGNAFDDNTLLIKGDGADSVSLLDGWTAGATVNDPFGETGSFVIYTNGAARLLVENEIQAGTIDLTKLTAAQGFIIQGDAAGDNAGESVSAAGDVNGDGFGDLIVGAFWGDDAGPFAGEAYVVFGSAAGFGAPVNTGGYDRQVIDLTTFSPAEGFIIQGDTANDYAGYSVSTAGDVNGDGFADLIVGAVGYDGGPLAGGAYVVFGKASGFGATVNTAGFDRQVIDLTTLSAADGFIIQGDTAGDLAGVSVSDAGDVNGDGFADLIVGALSGDDGGSDAGEAYVVFGKASGFGATINTGGFDRQVIDLTTLSAAEGFIIQGDTAGDQAGQSVSTAGDVNGDGFSDLVVGAHLGDDGGNYAGEAYVVFGKASGFGATFNTGGFDRQVIDLKTLSAADGFIIQGDTADDLAGFSVSDAGDVNGDGFADLIVGAFGGDDGGSWAGEAYVVFGKAAGFGATVNAAGFDRQVIDLTTLSADDGFIIQGDTAGDAAGWSVSAAGDVNGDGFGDLIIGARAGDDGGDAAGEAYILFGMASGFGTTVNAAGFDRQVIDLTSLSAIIQGDTAGDLAGWSVSAAGDVNGDGFADLIVGAPAGDDGGSDAGEAYVLFGGAFGALSAPVTTMGNAAAEIFVGALGDDTLTGGGGADVFHSGAGNDVITIGDVTAHLVDGGTGTDTLALAGAGLTLDLTNRTLAAKIEGIERVDLTGSGNNTLKLDQLAVFNETAASGIGVHILTVEGNPGDVVTFTETQWTNVGPFSDASGSFDRYVFGLAEVRVEQGLTVNVPVLMIDLTTLTAAQGFIIQGDTVGDYAGWSVSSAGDVNGDGFADFIVGARGGDDGGNFAGEAYVVFGKSESFGATVNSGGVDRQVIDLTSLSAADGFIIQGDTAGDYAGWSVSAAGDVNGDGFADLIVGARGDDGGEAAGEAYVLFGKASGFGATVNTGGFDRQVIDLTILSAADGFVVQGDTAVDYAGWSVSAAGDVNGDGFDDLIVGAWGGDDGGIYAGEVYVVFGKSGGFGATVNTGGFNRQVIDLTTLLGADGFIIQGDTANDYAGYSVSAAGDVNGDGFDDLIVGAKNGDDGGYDAGEAYVLFGKASGFGAIVNTAGYDRQVIDLTALSADDGFIIQGDAGSDLAGFSVSDGGDVNGDGFADLIVGAIWGDDGGSDAGEAYVVFGKASGFGAIVNTDGHDRQVIDLTALSADDGFIVQGNTAGDGVGISVSAAGDVNGDGFGDLIVGASSADNGGNSAGEAYVVFGKALGFGATVNTGGYDRQVIDLTSLSPTDGLIIQGDSAYDLAGRSVSTAGDVNGDGFADLIVGAYRGDDGGISAGEAYVVFGGAFGASTAPVTTIGSAAAEIFVGGLGDDTLTGGGGADVFHSGAGNDVVTIDDLTAHLVDGGTGTDTLALAGADLALDLTNRTLAAKIEGIERIDLTGSGNNTLTLDQLAVFNETPASGNGVHILTVEGNSGDVVTFTETQWTNVGTFSDASGSFDRYVFGLAEVRVEQGLNVPVRMIDLTTLSVAQGFIIQGDRAGDLAGVIVSDAGDVNGDGFADLIVGALGGDDGGSYAGEAYVVFGRASGFGATVNTGGFDRQVIDLTSLSAADGFIIQGDTAGDQAGFSVSAAGDLNGDGFGDLIVGAHRGADGGNWAGEAYVVFGMASGFGTAVNTGGVDRQVIDLATLSAADGFIIQGDTANDYAGRSVSAAGDVNGDGFADLIVGAWLGDDGGYSAGEVYVVFGKESGFGATVNTGGYDRQVIDLTAMSAIDGFIIQGDTAGDLAGVSVSDAGDVNGDGFADLIVGAYQGDDGGSDAGEAYVVFGKAAGFGATVNTGGFDRQVIDLTTLSAADGFIIQGDTVTDRAGVSVSDAGDVNGDGFADLIVGAFGGDDGGSWAGEAYVVFGKASGFGTAVNTGGVDRQVIDLTSLSAVDGFIIQGDTAGDRAGFSVSAAGDVNGDGFADLIVGAFLGADGGIYAGEAYVLFGKASGFGTTVNTDGVDRQVIDLTGLSAADGFIIQGDTVADRAGVSVSAAGDVNGDGFADLLVGAYRGDDGGTDAGEAYVIFGAAFGASTAPVTTTGSAAAEIFVGGLGEDTLTGGGGADVFHSGAGDDVITVADFLFGLADGGTGNDKLVLLGSAASFDFTALADNETQSIEAIDFSGSGDNTLTLGLTDVLNMPDGRNFDFTGVGTVPKSMVIDGDAGDMLQLGSDPRGVWIQTASDVNLDGSASGAYDFWVFDAGATDFTALAVYSTVNVVPLL